MSENNMKNSLERVSIRLVEEPPLLSKDPINNPEAAIHVLGSWLEQMDRELFCIINLRTDLRPINMNIVSVGALNYAQVHPRETVFPDGESEVWKTIGCSYIGSIWEVDCRLL